MFLFKKFNIPKISCFFFYLKVVGVFELHLGEILTENCFFLKYVQGFFFVLEKSVIYLGLLLCFLVIFDEKVSKTMSVSSFVCDCIKTSSKFLFEFLLIASGLKILLINAEKAAVLCKFHRIIGLIRFVDFQ